MKTHYGTHHWPIRGLGLFDGTAEESEFRVRYPKIKPQPFNFSYIMAKCCFSYQIMCFYADDTVLATKRSQLNILFSLFSIILCMQALKG